MRALIAKLRPLLCRLYAESSDFLTVSDIRSILRSIEDAVKNCTESELCDLPTVDSLDVNSSHVPGIAVHDVSVPVADILTGKTFHGSNAWAAAVRIREECIHSNTADSLVEDIHRWCMRVRRTASECDVFWAREKDAITVVAKAAIKKSGYIKLKLALEIPVVGLRSAVSPGH